MSSRTPKVTSSLLIRRARALHRYLPAAIAGDDAGVHQARVASRRLREAVPVLAGGIKHVGKARRKIRRLTRALGIVRELDVSLHLLDELAASDELSRPALQDVRLHVMEERDKKREEMLSRLADVNADKLERRLKSVTDAVELDDSETWRQALGARLVKRAKWLGDAIDDAGHLYAPERLHQVRIAAKKLRYGLELAADSGVSAALPLVRALKRSQEMLGRLNDLQVLQTHVAAVQAAPIGRSVPHQGLAAIAGRIEEECRRIHGRYVAQADALREVTVAVPSTVVPRLARRTRPLKMGLAPRGAAEASPRRPRACHAEASPRRRARASRGDLGALSHSTRHRRRTWRGVSGRLQASSHERRYRAPEKGSQGARGARRRLRSDHQQPARSYRSRPRKSSPRQCLPVRR